MTRKVLLSWSSGKDSAWALHVLRSDSDVEVVGLLTTFNQEANRVAMHAVRRSLVEAQASVIGLPLLDILLPWPCSNEVYEERFSAMLAIAREQGVTHIAFGDLFLEDIRDYRVRQLAGTGIEPLFPIWGDRSDTKALSKQMIRSGLKAILTCVDPRRLSASFVGRVYDEELLNDLPADVDPCGENGEFHTFCFAGPMFDRELKVSVGERVDRDGFCFADVIPS